MLEIQRVVCGAYQENAYIVNGDIVIDPGDDIAALRSAVPKPRVILLTHGHFDHILAAEELQSTSGAKVYIHDADAAMLSDAELSMYDGGVARLPMPTAIHYSTYGDTFENFRVIRTPGHTPGSVCLYDAQSGILFTGDTLFRAGFGRTDFAGGSMSQMITSIRGLFQLPVATVCYPGHGEATNIGEERGRYGW